MKLTYFLLQFRDRSSKTTYFNTYRLTSTLSNLKVFHSRLKFKIKNTLRQSFEGKQVCTHEIFEQKMLSYRKVRIPKGQCREHDFFHNSNY